MKYIIYKTTNLINGKIYIGVHKTETPYIFDGYYGNGVTHAESSYLNQDCLFHRAIRKYGLENFKRETLFVYNTIEEALEKEKEIVNEDFLKRNDVYNVTIGGGLPPIISRKIFQYNLDGSFYKEWDSILNAIKYFGGNGDGMLHNAIKYKTASLGSFWSFDFVEKLDITQYSVYQPCKKVYIYDSDNHYLKSYNSMSDCFKDLKVNLSNVQRSIKYGYAMKGLHASFIKSEIYEKPSCENLLFPVYKLDIYNNNIITIYENIDDLVKDLGNNANGVDNAIRFGYSFEKCLWSNNKDCFPKCNTNISAQIGQYDLDGNLIHVFNSVREARKQFGNVSKVLSGKEKVCKGYTFKYMNRL